MAWVDLELDGFFAMGIEPEAIFQTLRKNEADRVKASLR